MLKKNMIQACQSRIKNITNKTSVVSK